MPEKSTVKVICPLCFGDTGRGLKHLCTPAQAVKNLAEKAASLGAQKAEQVASSLVKKSMMDKNVERGEEIKLATSKTDMEYIYKYLCSICKSKIYVYTEVASLHIVHKGQQKTA